MRFSVVVVNHNGLGWSRRAVESALSQEGVAVQVVVVDNGSTDGSLEEIEALGDPRLTVLKIGYNSGFCEACNRGFLAADGDMVCQLNDDAEYLPGALKAVDQGAEQNPTAGSFALSMRFLDRPTVLNSTGALVRWDGTGLDRDYGRRLNTLEALWNYDLQTRDTLGPCGGASAWRREVLAQLLPLPDFFIYGEDTDMALRARRLGYGSVYLPRAAVLHRGSMTTGKWKGGRKMELLVGNAAKLMVRNFGWPALARGLLVFTVRTAILTAKGDPEAAPRRKALLMLWRERGELGKQRAAIRATGPDARVAKWIGLHANGR